MRSALNGITGYGNTTMRDTIFLGFRLMARRGRCYFCSRMASTRQARSQKTTCWNQRARQRRHPGSNSRTPASNTPALPHIRTPAFLKQVTHEAGGRSGRPRRAGLQELFRRAIRDMRDRYVLTYAPSGVSRPGWHALSVKLVQARGDVVTNMVTGSAHAD